MEPTLTIDPDGTQKWRVDGRLHRLAGPAVIRANGTEEWWVDGRLHRLDAPAVVHRAILLCAI